MTRRSLTLILLDNVSLGALGYALRGEEVSARASVLVVEPVAALGLLARMRVWLHVMFSGMCGRRVSVQPLPLADIWPLNRCGQRSSKHRLVLGRCTYVLGLGYILLRRYSYARFVQWLCNHTLICRVERCFTSRCFWGTRRRVAGVLFCRSNGRDLPTAITPRLG